MEATYIYNEEVEQQSTNEENVMQLYNEVTEDYEIWSKDLNMHFGYYIPFKTSLFKRDTMLNAMNKELFSRLHIDDKKAHILDMGCGMGATMKFGLNKYPDLAVTGCTLSSFQVEFGKIIEKHNLKPISSMELLLWRVSVIQVVLKKH